MIKEPNTQPGWDDLDDDEKRNAIKMYKRFAPIELEVRRVKRPERQAWEREFAHILANDEIVKRGGDLNSVGLAPATIEALEDYNVKIANAAIVKVHGLIVGDDDISEATPEEAIEALAECGLIGYAAKAARVAQAPTIHQGES